MSWKDEEGDLVNVCSQEELDIGLKEIQGTLLAIHITVPREHVQTMDMSSDIMEEDTADNDLKTMRRKMIRMPEEYLDQVKGLDGKIQMEDMKIVKTVISREEMKKLIIKYPGIAFVRGMKFGGKEMEVGQEVSRIVEAS